MSSNFDYYNLEIRLISEQFGTCTRTSIYEEHILKRAQKLIKKANRLQEKVSKAMEKFKGSEEISEDKWYKEMKGCVLRYQELLGKKEPLPLTTEDLLEYALEQEKDLEDTLTGDIQKQATVFLRDDDGKPLLSSHMVLGNLKENLRIITNNSTTDKKNKVIKYKTQVGEMLALDIKPINQFMHPSRDIVRDENGNPKLYERPINFPSQFGGTETAIALSEYLPIGTEYSVGLRVRKDSLINANDAELLKQLLDYGKNNGMGQWRGSGNKGAYVYKLTKLRKDPTPIPEGWN